MKRVVINSTLAAEGGINVERMVAFYRHWDIEVVTSDAVGRTKTSKVCSCCGKKQNLENFPQVIRADGKGGRRSRWCQACTDLRLSKAERIKMARRRLVAEKKEAERQGITVRQLRERASRSTYIKMGNAPSANP